MTHRGTVVAMYSRDRRAEVRERTIEAFARVGCPVAHVEVQSTPPRARENRRTARAALLRAAQGIAPAVGASGVLLIEDDVVPADTLREWLEHLEATEARAVTLYAHEPAIYPKRLARVARGERDATASEVATVANLSAWWGSQAIWFPVGLALDLVRDVRMEMWEHGLGPFDITLRVLLAERGATLGVAVPNVVQHLGLPNLVSPNRKPHTSAAFRQDASAPAKKEAAHAPRS